MSVPYRNKLLAGLKRVGVLQRAHRSWLLYGLSGVVCAALVAVLFHGCEQRELVRPTPQMNIESQFWVRVLLGGDLTECTLRTRSPAHLVRPGLGTVSSGSGPSLPPLRVATKVVVSGGQLVLGGTPLPGKEITLNPETPHVFVFNGREYRGKLRLTLDPQRRAFEAVNLVPLEPYLAGVVGAEMPDYWEPEALKAQAIAARTYCLYSKNRFGVNRRWDVSKTQASQVYAGVSAESVQVWNAVNRTYGKVLLSATDALRGRRDVTISPQGLFPAYYSSVCGGHTEDSANVFGDTFGPLKGAPCPYCKDVAKLGFFFWPMAQFDRATATERLVERYPQLAALGQIKDIIATEKTDYGEFSRLTRIKLIGSTGKTDVLRGEDLRLTLDPTGRKIKSTACHIVAWGDGWAFLSGRGWGHGVGLCQYGAEGMARLGKSAEEILQHYYPGSRIVSLYGEDLLKEPH
ncbi:MAG: SpoIID/LytB domain-containing protein [Sedimentisphaerales bacterium]|nr:SpoIID/LytB domain-containing protein [Sedimentisphaerales bacterium]